MRTSTVDRTPTSAEAESTTRQRILRLVAEAGPVSVIDLAGALDLSAAGVRRHVAALEDAGQIAVHAVTLAPGHARRGRPARRYVATDRGQSALSSAYSGLAAEAMRFLAEVGGPAALQSFAARRVGALEMTVRPAVEGAGPDVGARVDALATALGAQGYAASARPVPGGRAVQLCQGHCPVRDVAAQFPQLCEAETQMFSRLLGVHVQRLSTLAAGGHVCTTHVPMAPLRAGTTSAVASSPASPGTFSPDPMSPTSSTSHPAAATDCPAPAETVEGTQ